MIKIIIPIALIISLISFIIFGINNKTQPAPLMSEKPTRAFLEDRIYVLLKEGTDIKSFAKRHNMPIEKIEKHDLKNYYTVPIVEGEDFLGIMEKLKKDPDVVKVQPVVLYAPF